MPHEKKPKFQNTMALKDFPESDEGDYRNYPERRLWVSIVLFALQEYEDTLAMVQKIWSETRAPVSKFYLQNIRELRYEMQHDWFTYICDLGDISQHQVLRKIKQLDLKYKFADVEFTREGYFVTRFQLKKIKKVRDNRALRINKRHD
jgi:hypothetical protein